MLQSPAACSKTLLLTPSQSGREAGKTPPVFLLAFVSKVDVRLNACLQFHPRPRFCCKTIYPPGALADFYRKTFCFLSAAAFRGSSTKHDVFLKWRNHSDCFWLYLGHSTTLARVFLDLWSYVAVSLCILIQMSWKSNHETTCIIIMILLLWLAIVVVVE